MHNIFTELRAEIVTFRRVSRFITTFDEMSRSRLNDTFAWSIPHMSITFQGELPISREVMIDGLVSIDFILKAVERTSDADPLLQVQSRESLVHDLVMLTKRIQQLLGVDF